MKVKKDDISQLFLAVGFDSQDDHRGKKLKYFQSISNLPEILIRLLEEFLGEQKRILWFDYKAKAPEVAEDLNAALATFDVPLQFSEAEIEAEIDTLDVHYLSSDAPINTRLALYNLELIGIDTWEDSSAFLIVLKDKFNSIRESDLVEVILGRGWAVETEEDKKTAQASMVYQMAEMAAINRSYEEAVDKFEQALSIYQETDNKQREALTLQNIASIYGETHQFEKAIEIFGQALSIWIELDVLWGTAVVLDKLISVYGEIGYADEAFVLYQHAISLWRELGDEEKEADTMDSMAWVFKQAGQPEKAIKLLEEALLIYRELNKRGMEANTLNNLAENFNLAGNSKKAISLYKTALQIWQEERYGYMEGITLEKLADLYRQNGQPQIAMDHLQQSLIIMAPNREMAASIFDKMAEISYLDLKDVVNGIEYKEAAIEVLEKSGLEFDSRGQSVNDLKSSLEEMRKKNIDS